MPYSERRGNKGTHSKFNRRREEFELLSEFFGEGSAAGRIRRQADEAGGGDTLLALQRADDFACKLGAGERHGEGS